jgi:nitroreductase
VDEIRHALASFRTFAVSELSLGLVLIMFSIHLQRKSGRQARSRSPGNHPAVQNMLLAARALGLGATLTTLYLQFEKEAEPALGLPPGVHSYAILPIGSASSLWGKCRRSQPPEVFAVRAAGM